MQLDSSYHGIPLLSIIRCFCCSIQQESNQGGRAWVDPQSFSLLCNSRRHRRGNPQQCYSCSTMEVRTTASEKKSDSWCRWLVLWVPLVFIGILNGVLREVSYARFFSELTAHQISTVTGIVFFSLYVWLIAGRWKLESSSRAITVGFAWMVLTVAFEFVFGLYVMGQPWSRLLRDYQLFEGRLWTLMLFWILVAPYIMTRLRTFVRFSRSDL